MAIALVGARTSNYSNSTTTLTASLTAAQTGNFSLLFIGFHPRGDQLPTVSVTDTSSNTWTLLSSYSAPATTTNLTTGGIISQIFYSNTAVSGSSVTITMTFSDSTYKNYQLLTFSGTNSATNATIDTVRYATMGDGTQRLSSTRTIDSGDLIIANHIGRGSSGTLTATSTTTDGTWVPSNTTFYRQGNGATGSSGITNNIAYKIATGTGNQTVDESWVTSALTGTISLLQIVKILQASPIKTAIATGAGNGTETANGKLILVRVATGSGVGDSVIAVAYEAYRSAYGSGGSTTDDTAEGDYVRVRTASNTANGSSSVVQLTTHLTVAVSSGEGTADATGFATKVRNGSNTASSGFSVEKLRTTFADATDNGSSGSVSDGLHISPRTASDVGSSSSSVMRLRTVLRAVTDLASSSSAVASYVTAIRTATSSDSSSSVSEGLIDEPIAVSSGFVSVSGANDRVVVSGVLLEVSAGGSKLAVSTSGNNGTVTLGQ